MDYNYKSLQKKINVSIMNPQKITRGNISCLGGQGQVDEPDPPPNTPGLREQHAKSCVFNPVLTAESSQLLPP